MNRSQNRKIAYLLGIVILLTLMIWVGQSLGGLQERYEIAQRSLGKVNPVSGTAQLVLGGFRGVAVTVLWSQAQELQRRGKFFEIEPVVESITLLQPHFRRPWEFQAWNFAFNVASDWEAVEDKYYWINKGINFMTTATETNRRQADLEWYVGHMYFTRFGQSDESEYLRQLFREDDDLEFAESSLGVKDSFLKAYDWYRQANQTCLDLDKPPQRMGPHPFMCRPALSRSYYADFLAKEGTFGEATSDAWRQSFREWVEFGLLGSTDRVSDWIYRLEYSPSERAELTENEEFWRHHYDRIIRYDFWKLRCETESSPDMQAARAAIYKARDYRVNGAYAKAVESYETGIPLWRKIMEENEVYRGDLLYQDECQEMEDEYLRLLAHIGRPTPARRPFDGIVRPLRDSIQGLVDEAYQEARESEAEANEPAKAPAATLDPESGSETPLP